MGHYLCLSVIIPDVSTEVKAGRVHAPGGAGDITSHVGHVTITRYLHLAELSAEGDHCTPQR